MLTIVGDPPDAVAQAQTAVEAIKVLSKAFPRPTNAQALAILSAPFEAIDKAAGEQAGFPSDVSQAWFLPFGVLPRLRLIACGWFFPKDKFKSADDSAWWAAEYGASLPLQQLAKGRIWIPLLTYAQTAEQVGHTEWFFDDAVSKGDSTAISKQLLAMNDELQTIRANFADGCLPYATPIKPGLQPKPNPTCFAFIDARKKGLLEPKLPPNPFGRGFPPWVYFGIVLYLLTKLPE